MAQTSAAALSTLQWLNIWQGSEITADHHAPDSLPPMQPQP
jgi:hypothetical protein